VYYRYLKPEILILFSFQNTSNLTQIYLKKSSFLGSSDGIAKLSELKEILQKLAMSCISAIS